MAAHLVREAGVLLVPVPGVEAVADRGEVGRGLLRRPVRGLAGGPGHGAEVTAESRSHLINLC